MKHIHKRDCISIALVTIVLISLCAGCASPLVNAAGGDSATNVRPPAFVGAPVAGAPAACAQGSNSLDLFVRGTDNALWWERWNGATWSNWAVPRRGPDLVTRRDLTGPAVAIDVFVRGTDNALWERTTTDGGALLERLDLDRRADCFRHRTCGVLAGCRQPRRLCTRHERRPVS